MKEEFEFLEDLKGIKNMNDVDTLIKWYTSRCIDNGVCPECGGELEDEIIELLDDYHVCEFVICENCNSKFSLVGGIK